MKLFLLENKILLFITKLIIINSDCSQETRIPFDQ